MICPKFEILGVPKPPPKRVRPLPNFFDALFFLVLYRQVP